MVQADSEMMFGEVAWAFVNVPGWNMNKKPFSVEKGNGEFHAVGESLEVAVFEGCYF